MISDGKPEIEHGENQRGRAERLKDPDHELAAIGQQPQVVQLVVVEAELADGGDEHRLRKSRGSQHLQRIFAKAQPCGERDRGNHEERLTSDERERPR